MPKRGYVTPSQPDYQQETNTLPLDKPIAIYYRQSTKEQVGNVSTAMQQEDLPNFIRKLGWKEDQIIPIFDDEGLSGTLPIDKRKGMTKVHQMIQNNLIGAVAVISVDRLFRDEDQIQPNIYLRDCRKNHIWTITPNCQYCFHGRDREYYEWRFRQESQYAADYIKRQIVDKLIAAKHRVARSGKWVGGKIPLGYGLDKDNRYIPVEPYASLVRLYFEVLAETKGNVLAANRLIKQRGLLIPDPESEEITTNLPDGIRLVVTHDKKTKIRLGYKVNYAFLSRLGTNVAYIGYWVSNGELVEKENHPPIVPTLLFWEVFNYLSPVGLTGEANPSYNPPATRWVESQKPEGLERPLYEGYIYTPTDSGVKRAILSWDKQLERYNYLVRETQESNALWTRSAPIIDSTITALLRERLNNTQAEEVLGTEDQLAQHYMTELKYYQSLLDALQEEKAQIEINISRLKSVKLIEIAEARYNAIEAEERRIQAKLSELRDSASLGEQLRELRLKLVNLGEHWESLTYAQRRKAVELCVKSVDVELNPDTRELEVTVVWQDSFFHEGRIVHHSDRFIIPRGKMLKGWFTHEEEQLKAIKRGSSQLDIMQMFPNRTWQAISLKYKKLTGQPITAVYVKTRIRDEHSYNMYLSIINHLIDPLLPPCNNKTVDDGRGFSVLSMLLPYELTVILDH